MTRAWPLFFAASVALQWPLLRAWDARGFNRWLTLRPWLPERAVLARTRWPWGSFPYPGMAWVYFTAAAIALLGHIRRW
jgi:hypothetical protein